jgi:tRNA dimethylallyltransferase
MERDAELPGVLVIAGPTAVGKTGFALQLAEYLNAEIVSADSRQVYRRMNVGTAKPTETERLRVPHHLVDDLEPDEPFSAGAFARSATAHIQDIVARGRIPLVVGGSTLYLHALLHGLAEIPPVDLAVRERMQARLASEGADVLFEELRCLDPASAARMDASKTQRLVRALEVYHGTGAPLSSYFDAHHSPAFHFTTLVLERERAVLHARIDARVHEMMESGLVDEVRGLLRAGLDPAINALQSIGYREPVAYLQGQISENEMVRLIKRNTRRYARRQMTWFRRYVASGDAYLLRLKDE